MHPTENNKADDSKETEEHFLCRKCGLCCDGTMFRNVRLVDEDLHFIESNNPGVALEDQKRNFIQPCRYHVDSNCKIYTEWRPRACTRYICKVIKRLRNNELTFVQANEVIDKALSHAKRVRSQIVPYVNNHRQGLFTIFNEYIATQAEPNPAILLDYGALEFRLKRDFGKYENNQKATGDPNQESKSD